MKHETAGDPITGLKWTRKTTENLALELAQLHIYVSANTVARLLKGIGYQLRVNFKVIESGNRNPPEPGKRDEQFRYIKNQRFEFSRKGNPVISVDTKKKELIGPSRTVSTMRGRIVGMYSSARAMKPPPLPWTAFTSGGVVSVESVIRKPESC